MALRFQTTKIIPGSGPPSAATGDFGDYYFDRDNDTYYGPKEESGWPAAVSMVGPRGIQGEKGDTGESFDPDFIGTRANRSIHNDKPLNTSYLAEDESILYFKTSSEVGDFWTAGTPFGKGEKGDPGETGPQGIQGEQGPQGMAGRGFTPRGEWVSGASYAVDDIVTIFGATYRRKIAGAGTTGPDSDATNWELWAARGAVGATGPGLAAGGTAGQVARKKSEADYDTEWADPDDHNHDTIYPAGDSAGAADGQVWTYDQASGGWLPGTLQSVGTIARTRKAAYICGGTNGTKTGITQMNTRHVVRLVAKTTRWRLRISNTNIRDEIAGGDISLTSIHTGKHAPNSEGGWTGNMQSGILQIQGAQAIVGGAEFVTGWVTDSAHQFAKYSDRVISIGFTAVSSAAIATSPNKSFQNTTTSTSSTLAPTASALTNESPLSIVVEYDFQGEQEVGLFMGDSITDGAVTVRGVASTYANQFAQAHDCLSIVHAAGGSQAQDWVINGYKWNRLPLAEMDIDFAVISLGTNDLGGGGRTPAQLKANLLTIIQRLKGLGVKKIFFGRMTPRRDPSTTAGWDTTKEGYRQEINDWMGTFPGDVYGSIFFDHAVRSSTDETQLAGEFQTDILHPDTSGHSRMAAELAHVLKGSAILSGPQGVQGAQGPPGAGGAEYETRRYLATPFTNTTLNKASGFDTAVLANPQIVIPALGTPPLGYEWRIDVEGSIRYAYSVAASVGFCVNSNGLTSNALIGLDYATANQQDVVPLAGFGMVPPSTSAQITIDFTAYANAAGSLTIYQTLRPKATCYLAAI